MTAHIETAAPETTADLNTRLRGRALSIARSAWFVIVALVFGLFLLGVSLQIARLQVPCSGTECIFAQPTIANLQELQQIGLPLNLYVAYVAGIELLFALVFATVAILIFVRKSRDWLGIYVSLALITIGATFSDPIGLVGTQYPALRPLTVFLSALSGVLIGTLFYIFPDGHFVPRWTRWLVPFLIIRETANVLVPDSPLQFPVFVFELATFLFAQIYRYRRVSDAVQRQQTKWFVYGTSAAFLGFVGLILFFDIVFPNGAPTTLLPNMIGGAALHFFILLVPISLMMAILRYRLWDIDLIISRSLVYLPLTAILAGIFAATITLCQKGFIAVTGQSSDLAAVISTLLVVAAFTPIKDRLQGAVDARFKDADSTKRLKAFCQQVRARMAPVEARHVTQRLLEEAVGSFGAIGGAAFLGEDTQPFYAIGQWNGESKVGAILQTAENRGRVGNVALGARRNKVEYTAHDRLALEQAAQIVAQAIEEDRTN